MKKLNYVLLLIISVLLLTGCGIFGDDGSDVEKFEPYEIGAFKIVAENEAEWIGKQSYSKAQLNYTMADTIEIEQPGQRSLKLWQEDDQDRGQFHMQFRDSSFTKSDVGVPLSNIASRFYNPKGDGGYPIGVNGYGLKLHEDYLQFDPSMLYNCGSEFNSNNPIIHIRFQRRDTGEEIRTYAVFVDGIIETVEEIACN